MSGSLTRRAAGAVLALLLGAALAGCSDDDSPSTSVSKAASAVESAAESAASRATEAWASATAEAGDKLDEIKGGADATKDVSVGTPKTDSDGRATVELTVDNSADDTRSYAVQVNFTDQNGNILDATVVTVSDVPSDRTKDATARSNRDLTGDLKAEVARAVRY
ncbi:hypothetical protein [Streptomyces sp. NPDC093094]|uniref:hypothetical protein n=1 Tax=Streptomyces sp. NPDC093094 TaxID=3366026 RepID=UPI0037F6EA6A